MWWERSWKLKGKTIDGKFCWPLVPVRAAKDGERWSLEFKLVYPVSSWKFVPIVDDPLLLAFEIGGTDCSTADGALEFACRYGPLGFPGSPYGLSPLVREDSMQWNALRDDIWMLLRLWEELSDSVKLEAPLEPMESQSEMMKASLKQAREIMDPEVYEKWAKELKLSDFPSFPDRRSCIISKITNMCEVALSQVGVRLQAPFYADGPRSTQPVFVASPQTLLEAIFMQLYQDFATGAWVGRCKLSSCRKWWVARGRQKSGEPKEHCCSVHRAQAFREMK